MGTTIDLTDPALQSALDEWAEALGVLAEVQQGLVRDIQQAFDLPAVELHGFDYLALGSEIRVAGEWHRVIKKVCRTEEDGYQARRLLLVESDADPRPAPFWYEVGDGETFQAADPF